MRIQDLHDLPKVRDSISYLYLERCRVEQQNNAIAVFDSYGLTPLRSPA